MKSKNLAAQPAAQSAEEPSEGDIGAPMNLFDDYADFVRDGYFTEKSARAAQAIIECLTRELVDHGFAATAAETTASPEPDLCPQCGDYRHEPEDACHEATKPTAWQERTRLNRTQWSGWYEFEGVVPANGLPQLSNDGMYEWRPLYAHPPKTEPAALSDEDAFRIYREALNACPRDEGKWPERMVRAILAAAKGATP